MSRALVFGVLLAVSAVTGWVAWRTDPAFSASLATEIFWLTLGTMLVTTVLETVLEAASRRERRAADRLAFRTFTASLMIRLGEVVELEETRERELLGAVIGDQARFAQIVRAAADAIESASGFSPRAYLAHYGQIERELRDLSRNYIRLLAGTEAEMVQRYRALDRLADRWPYVDGFTESAMIYAEQERSRLADREADFAERGRALAVEAGASPEDRSWLEKSRRQIEKQEQEVARERAGLDGKAAGLALQHRAAIAACRETARALAEAAIFVARRRGLAGVG
jgi:hypothetical protein